MEPMVLPNALPMSKHLLLMSFGQRNGHRWTVEGFLRKQLLKMHTKDCKKTGKKLVNRHEDSTDDDRIAIVTARIWVGDAKSAHFLVLEAAKCYAAGRCQEVSFSKVKDLCIRDVNENRKICKGLAFKVNRDNTGQ